jgi:hypothetical protein
MNVQFGTFKRKGSVHDLLVEAEDAMRGNGFQVFNNVGSNNSMVIGGNADVMVQATAMSTGPEETFLIVSAYSQDASIAEQARNTIRDGIKDLFNL